MDEIHRLDSFPFPCHVYLHRRFHNPPRDCSQKGPFKGALPFRMNLLFPCCDNRLSIAHYIYQ